MSNLVLSPELNERILKLAPRHSVADNAPYSFQGLKECAVSGLVVWSGASDRTIYGAPSVNHAFRAWHDSLHLKLNADFSLQGETLVTLEQCRLIGSDNLARILWAESVGQVEFFNKYGHFPTDQVEFMRNYLKGKV